MVEKLLIKMIIENYLEALQEIYNHVGFEEDWVVYPIDDCTKYYWSIDDETVEYADSLEEFISEEGNHYTAEIYKQRFYDKWVYEGKLYTMIFLNPNVDGMKYFSLFDNNKRQQTKIR